MKVGDLVIMPGAYSREDQAEIGVVVATSNSSRICVYWFDYQEQAWEPKKWLEVISESR
jgi:hypothetical protein